MRISDWSSDVCSSDLCPGRRKPAGCKRIQSADPQTATSGTPVAAAATGEPMASVEIDKLRKVDPNGSVGVADASFDVADGELLVPVGPSGSGKSTLMRMIAGVEQSTLDPLQNDVSWVLTARVSGRKRWGRAVS